LLLADSGKEVLMRTSIMTTWPFRVLLLAGALFSGACESSGVRASVYVPTAPPPPVYERVYVAPGEGYVWIAGHHTWTGRSYVWVGGRWEQRPHARARWHEGYWRHDRRGYVWIEGRWR
jgi:hypothetical protein